MRPVNEALHLGLYQSPPKRPHVAIRIGLAGRCHADVNAN